MPLVNKARLISLLKRTISISTVNPPGQERTLAMFLRKYLQGHGIRASIAEYYPERSNLLGYLKAASSRKTLVVSPHLDTVPASSGLLRPRLAKGRIYGRGATDCKGNLCAVIESLIILSRHHRLQNLDIVLCAVADEEAGSKRGLIPLLKQRRIRGDFWLILDSDDFRIVTAQKGLLHLKIIFKGKPVHASIPAQGRSAIIDAARFIQQISEIYFPHKEHALLKAPTVNPGTIRGGERVNMVAGECTLELDIRYLPGMRSTDIIEKVKTLLRATSRSFRIEVTDDQEPIEYQDRSLWVQALVQALQKNHVPVRRRGSEGATIMSILQDFGIPAISFGFGAADVAHSENEYVKLDDLCRGAQVLYDYFMILDNQL